jgi:hypothetical protein
MAATFVLGQGGTEIRLITEMICIHTQERQVLQNRLEIYGF